MKSLIEEASTIGKAIEKAWERAGFPTSFSVKICENPEYGFFGMTKKYGKIVIFFDDMPVKDQHNKKADSQIDSKKNRPVKQEKKIEKDYRLNEKNKKHLVVQSGKSEVPSVQSAFSKNNKEKPLSSSIEQEEEHSLKEKNQIKKSSSGYFWTDPMVEYVHSMVEQTIILLSRSDISFSLKNEQQNLKVIFNGLLVQEQHKEHIFYKHFAHLLITALRTKFKTEFKYLRLVLSRE